MSVNYGLTLIERNPSARVKGVFANSETCSVANAATPLEYFDAKSDPIGPKKVAKLSLGPDSRKWRIVPTGIAVDFC